MSSVNSPEINLDIWGRFLRIQVVIKKNECNMIMENQPFEEVSPIQKWRFSIVILVLGGVESTKLQKSLFGEVLELPTSRCQMILCILQSLQLRSLPLGMDPTSKVRDLGVLESLWHFGEGCFFVNIKSWQKNIQHQTGKNLKQVSQDLFSDFTG